MKPSEFPGAIDFIEVPDESLRLGAFGVIVDRFRVAWAYDQETPRPITEEEIQRRGGFRVKPEDVDELVDDVLWPSVGNKDKRVAMSMPDAYAQACEDAASSPTLMDSHLRRTADELSA